MNVYELHRVTKAQLFNRITSTS